VIGAFLALSETVFVTEESASMVSEAVASGKSVVTLMPDKKVLDKNYQNILNKYKMTVFKITDLVNQNSTIANNERMDKVLLNEISEKLQSAIIKKGSKYKVMKKAVLLNDTSFENHHGCNKVVKNIQINLLKKNIELIDTNPIGKKWQTNTSFLKKLAQCDLVIVNAEGTIHHNSKYGFNLLKIVEYTNKPTILMNMTYQENSDEYIKLIEQFTQVYVRESRSKEELLKYGINVEVIPDMTFYNRYDEYIKSRKNKVCITDSHDIWMSEKLYMLSKQFHLKFLPIIAPYRKFSSTKGFIKKIKYGLFYNYGKKIFQYIPMKFSYARYKDIMEEDQYLAEIMSCQLLISARFHAICFAIQTKTPFFALKSNSHKIEGLLQDIQFDNSRIINIDSIPEQGFQNFNFTKEELLKIEKYMSEAQRKIEYMFTQIRDLVQ
jgi:polysaccharide pyruvyl transferase WcaK-like protein